MRASERRQNSDPFTTLDSSVVSSLPAFQAHGYKENVTSGQACMPERKSSRNMAYLTSFIGSIRNFHECPSVTAFSPRASHCCRSL